MIQEYVFEVFGFIGFRSIVQSFQKECLHCSQCNFCQTQIRIQNSVSLYNSSFMN